MTQCSTVVPNPSPVKEDEFHGAMIAGLGRCERKVGNRSLAFIMDVTTKQLRNIFAGSAPHPKRLWDALSACPTALDDVADLYGKRIVDKDAVCSTDDIGLHLARLHAWLEEARHPSSPGGTNITHTEKLHAEATARDLHGALSRFLEECSEIRRPRAVA